MEDNNFDNGCIGAVLGAIGGPAAVLSLSFISNYLFPNSLLSDRMVVGFFMILSVPLGIIAASIICIIRVQRIQSWFKRKK